MSALVNAAAISNYDNPDPCTFSANAVAGVIRTVVAPIAGAAQGALTPLYYGGCSILELLATSSDSANKDFQFYTGRLTTTIGAATGAVTTAPTVLTRATGSWVTDGWQIGDLVTVQSPSGVAPTSADGLVGVVSSVTASALTFVNVGTAYPNAITLNTGSYVYKISPWQRVTVPLGAGTASGVANYSVLGSAMESSNLRTDKKLGINTALLAAPIAALTAGATYVSFAAVIGRV